MCDLSGGLGVVAGAHLHSVGQRRVQHGEHGQVGTQIWHHTAAQALTTQIIATGFKLACEANSWHVYTYKRVAIKGFPHGHTLVNNLWETLVLISYHLPGCCAELRWSGALRLTPALQEPENTPVNFKENRRAQGANVTAG